MSNRVNTRAKLTLQNEKTPLLGSQSGFLIRVHVEFTGLVCYMYFSALGPSPMRINLIIIINYYY